MATAGASIAASHRSPLYKSLFAQVVAALILGIVLGMAFPVSAPD